MSKLTMWYFLAAYELTGVGGKEALIMAGFHPNVITAKAEKAARKGYVEYGGVADRCWLTAKGQDYLIDQGDTT